MKIQFNILAERIFMPKKLLILFLFSFLFLLLVVTFKPDIGKVLAEATSWTNSGSNMYANVSGNVGIGTTNPQFALQLSKGQGKPSGFLNDATGTDNDAFVTYRAGANSSGNKAFNFNTGKNSPNRLDLRLLNDALSASTRTLMTWGADGNVGIGTTTTRTKLTIAGSGATPTINYAQDALVQLQGLGNTGISMHAGDTSMSFVNFGSTNSQVGGRLDFNNNGDYFTFWINSINGFQDRLMISGNAVYFGEDALPDNAQSVSLGHSAYEWNQLFLGDDEGVSFGLDQNAALAYDETSDDRIELTGTNATLYVEDKFGMGFVRYTLANDGAGMKTLTPTTSYMEIVAGYSGAQGDHDDDFTLNETSAKRGDTLTIVNSDSSESIIFNESSNVVNLSAATVTMGPGDTVTLMYVYMDSDSGIWTQTGYSNN